jgi:hypothetical protein
VKNAKGLQMLVIRRLTLRNTQHSLPPVLFLCSPTDALSSPQMSKGWSMMSGKYIWEQYKIRARELT